MVVGAIMAMRKESEDEARQAALASGKSKEEAERLAQAAGEESFQRSMNAFKANISVLRWVAGWFK